MRQEKIAPHDVLTTHMIIKNPRWVCQSVSLKYAQGLEGLTLNTLLLGFICVVTIQNLKP